MSETPSEAPNKDPGETSDDATRLLGATERRMNGRIVGSEVRVADIPYGRDGHVEARLVEPNMFPEGAPLSANQVTLRAGASYRVEPTPGTNGLMFVLQGGGRLMSIPEGGAGQWADVKPHDVVALLGGETHQITAGADGLFFQQVRSGANAPSAPSEPAPEIPTDQV